MGDLECGEFLPCDDNLEVLEGQVRVDDDGDHVGEVAGQLQHELLVLAVAPEPDHVQFGRLVGQRVEHRFRPLDYFRLSAYFLLRVQLIFVDHGRICYFGFAVYYTEKIFIFHLFKRVV